MITKKDISIPVSTFHKAKTSEQIFNYKTDGKRATLDFLFAYDTSDISILRLTLHNGGDYRIQKTYLPDQLGQIVEDTNQFFQTQ
jgi:hypothetical protein